ncbi:MAG: NAD-binding protein [Bacteroidota bacterium]
MRKELSKPGLAERARYWFDNVMSRGAIAVITLLGILSLLIVIFAGLTISIAGITTADSGKMSFFEAAWQSLMRTFDAGTMGGDTGWKFRIVMLAVTIGGMFIISALIGIISNAIGNKIEELRKGRSKVIESGHTLIIGWSPKIFAIISELIIANENRRHARIVILAGKDKVEMEDELQFRIPKTKNTKIICRSGNPIDSEDLGIVNPNGARSIIILASEDDNSDISIIKTVLAITNNPLHADGDYHIVSEIGEKKNMRVGEMIGKGKVTFILNKDIISRMIVQTSRQSGMSDVFTELLDFDGDEIYFKEEPALTGKKFSEVLSLYGTSSVIGIFGHDKVVRLNPPMDTVLGAGDSIIAIAEDDDKVIMNGTPNPEIDQTGISGDKPFVYEPEKTLILGWNNKGSGIVRELDNYVEEGSEVLIISDLSETKAAHEKMHVEKYLKNLTVDFKKGSVTDRDLLEALDIAKYDHLILLSNGEAKNAQDADARTLVALLHVRDIAAGLGKNFNIVTEMLDIKNRELAGITSADDFIVSDKLLSLMLAQLSENKYLKPVFDDLFDADGSEIYIKPVSNYIVPGKEVNFYTVIKAAAARGEVAIGYRIMNYAGNKDKANGVVINPKKSDFIVFTPADKIIVIAED